MVNALYDYDENIEELRRDAELEAEWEESLNDCGGNFNRKTQDFHFSRLEQMLREDARRASFITIGVK